jgi:Flp pilus assembly protein TadG
MVRPTDRGASESLQWALITPALLLSVLGLVQGGVWLHGRQVLHSAAAAAAEAESVRDAPAGSGEGAARRVAGSTVIDLAVSVDRTPTRVVVTVTGRAPLFFEIGQGVLTARAAAPIEVSGR